MMNEDIYKFTYDCEDNVWIADTCKDGDDWVDAEESWEDKINDQFFRGDDIITLTVKTVDFYTTFREFRKVVREVGRAYASWKIRQGRILEHNLSDDDYHADNTVRNFN